MLYFVSIFQREAHLSCARCCENQLATKEQLEQCLQRSFQPVQQVQELISKELSQFQVVVQLFYHFSERGDGRCIKF